MKKFITTIALQVSNLEEVVYKASPESNLEYNTPNSYPILATIKNGVKENEKIEIIPICISDNVYPEVLERNYNAFLKQLKILADEIHFEYTILNPINKDKNDNYDSMVGVFSDLINYIEDNDELYACISYGTKSIPILTIMALHYAYKVKKKVVIKKIVYGNVQWADREKTRKDSDIFDVTPLFYIDSSLDKLANLKLANPDKLLKSMLGLGGNHE